MIYGKTYSSACFCFLEYMRLGNYKRAQEIANQLRELDKMLEPNNRNVGNYAAR